MISHLIKFINKLTNLKHEIINVNEENFIIYDERVDRKFDKLIINFYFNDMSS